MEGRGGNARIRALLHPRVANNLPSDSSEDLLVDAEPFRLWKTPKLGSRCPSRPFPLSFNALETRWTLKGIANISSQFQKSLTTPPAPLVLIFHIRPPSKTCPGHPLKPPSPSIASVLAMNLDGRRSVRRPACEPLNSTLGIFFADSHEARRMPSDVIPAPGDPLRPP